MLMLKEQQAKKIKHLFKEKVVWVVYNKIPELNLIIVIKKKCLT